VSTWRIITWQPLSLMGFFDKINRVADKVCQDKTPLIDLKVVMTEPKAIVV